MPRVRWNHTTHLVSIGSFQHKNLAYNQSVGLSYVWGLVTYCQSIRTLNAWCRCQFEFNKSLVSLFLWSKCQTPSESYSLMLIGLTIMGLIMGLILVCTTTFCVKNPGRGLFSSTVKVDWTASIQHLKLYGRRATSFPNTSLCRHWRLAGNANIVARTRTTIIPCKRLPTFSN